jgi:MurNAc alpha-1-phosphate uridylyltransferase
MHALILAAGRGQRMRPLTDACPKPLLPLAGQPIIVRQIERLRAAGIVDLVINLGWLGAQIPAALGDGSDLGVRIAYSEEPQEAYETGGAISTALPLLGGVDGAPFVVVSGDIDTDFDYARLHAAAARIAASVASNSTCSRSSINTSEPTPTTAHFVLTDNPPHHAEGDMALDASGRVRRHGQRLNYGNIGVFHPRLFARQPVRQAWKLFPWMYAEVEAGHVSGEHFRGAWHNLGTPEQLAALDTELRAQAARR